MKVSKFPILSAALAALIILPSALLQGQNNWKGAVSSDWNNPSNWSQGVPTSSSNVIISDTGSAPIVPAPGSDTAQTGNLKIQQGAILSFAPDPNPGVLVVYGTNQLLNQGIVYLGDGRIIFKNSISFQNGGTFNAGSGSMDFQGVTWSNSSGSTFVPGTSTITFSGTEPQTMTGDSISFYNVQFSNTSGSISLSGNITITNSVTVDSGASVTLTSGSLTLTTSATLELSGGSTLTIQGAFNNNGTMTGSGTLSSSKPLVQSVLALSTTSIDITFSESVDTASSQTSANYWINKDITVSSATRDGSNLALVHLTVSSLSQDTVYTMTINNVIDESATDTIAANTQRLFTYPPESLPVQLASFTAFANSVAAELRWSTATETNNYGFDVQRRIVGSNNWSKIGFVAGAGTSSSPRDYSYVDANLPVGHYAYRIKQIDNDGTFSYTGAVEVEVGLAPRELTLKQNYPNPFNPTTTIEFTLPEGGKATLKIYDILGREFATIFDGEVKAGYYQKATFDASRLASGIYIARLQFGGKQLLQKMLLMK